MRILVIEDDPSVSRLVRLILAEQGYVVDVANTAEDGRAMALATDYDAIVLDLELGDRHGSEVLAALRAAGKLTPVLVLTGRDDDESIVRSLDQGGDQYAVKPVSNEELRARVRALVRRGATSRTLEQLSVGNVTVNRLSRRVRVGDRDLALTPKELALLEHLMLRAGEVVTRAELLEKVWDMHFDPGSNVVDVHVTRLRRKLEQAEGTVAIVARRGFGFVLRGEDAAGSNPAASREEPPSRA
ncbi:MAG TPA: response regulator transcription factor [Gemmatimonadaceae bacterium]|nr:response regulator transcription factor [Gemmatimonadaceae bacterium]